MNIENHFHTAEAYLKTAKSQTKLKNYDTALAALCESYSNMRELIKLIYELNRTDPIAPGPAGDIPK